MSFKTVFAAAVLAALPALGFAMGCSSGQHAQSCAEGFVWDQAAGACVEQVSS